MRSAEHGPESGRPQDFNMMQAIQVLECGCRLDIDEVRDLVFLDPCSEAHKTVAERVRGLRTPSRLVVRAVKP